MLTELQILFIVSKNNNSMYFTDLLNHNRSEKEPNGTTDKQRIEYLIEPKKYLSGHTGAYDRIRLTKEGIMYLDKQCSTKEYKRLERNYQRQQKKTKDKGPKQTKDKLQPRSRNILETLGIIATIIAAIIAVLEFFGV